MSLSPKRIAVIGAGIGGLCAAACLLRHGHSVVILEKSDRLRTEGAGLQLSSNALYILNQLGLSKDFQDRLHRPSYIRLVTGKLARPLTQFSLKKPDRPATLMHAVVHRQDLIAALFDKVSASSRATIHFGVHHVDIVKHARGNTLNFETAQFDNERDHPDLIIGADGVHSAMRDQFVTPDLAPFSNYVAWRTLLPLENIPKHISSFDITAVFCNKMHVVLYPLPAHNQMNCVILQSCGKRLFDKISPEEQKMRMLKNTGKYQALKFLSHPAIDWHHWPLYATATPHFTPSKKDGKTPPITLLGDAAHAMLPFQAQGAAMAIEDAAALANSLLSHEVSEAIDQFAATRTQRVRKIMRQARDNGEIFHFTGPLALARNLFLRTAPAKFHQKRLDWIHDHEIDMPQIQPSTSTLMH